MKTPESCTELILEVRSEGWSEVSQPNFSSSYSLQDQEANYGGKKYMGKTNILFISIKGFKTKLGFEEDT